MQSVMDTDRQLLLAYEVGPYEVQVIQFAGPLLAPTGHYAVQVLLDGKCRLYEAMGGKLFPEGHSDWQLRARDVARAIAEGIAIERGVPVASLRPKEHTT